MSPEAAIYVPRVAKGAALLDAKKPGWVKTIDLSSLDMGDPCLCVLGQIFGYEPNESGWPPGYSQGLKALFNGNRQECDEHGFDLTDHDIEHGEELPAALHHLQEAWVAAILDRIPTAPEA